MLLNQQDVLLRYFQVIEELTAKSGFRSRVDSEDILSGGCDLLIHPELFAQTDFRWFCWPYDLLGCAECPHLQFIVSIHGATARVPLGSHRENAGSSEVRE